MAVNIKKNFSIDLRLLVDNAISNASNVKKQHNAEIETKFQQAILDGTMDYPAQIKFREDQISEEERSAYPDTDLLNTLKESKKSLIRLDRFQKYRSKYNKSYADLAAGRVSDQVHLSMLKEQLSMTNDPDLQLEIQKEITDAEDSFHKNTNAILKNKVTFAQNDGTVKVLNDAISKVQTAKVNAQLRGDDLDTSSFDATLSALNSQLNKTKVDDSINSAQIKGLTKGLGVADKLSALSDEINKADGLYPITIDGNRYDSAKAYWTSLRDGYLAGNGAGIWKDAFSELNSYYKERIDASVARDGYATSVTLDSVKNGLDKIKNMAEVAPYLQKVEDLKTNALGYALKSTAKTIVERAAFTGEFKTANQQLEKFEKDYGIDLQAERLAMANELASQALSQKVSPSAALSETGLTSKTFDTPMSIPASDSPTSTPQGLNTLKAYDKTGKEVYVVPGKTYEGVSLKPKATLYSPEGTTERVEVGSARASQLQSQGWNMDKTKTKPAENKIQAPAPAKDVISSGSSTPVVEQKVVAPNESPEVPMKKQATLYDPTGKEQPKIVDVGSKEASDFQAKGWTLTSNK